MAYFWTPATDNRGSLHHHRDAAQIPPARRWPGSARTAQPISTSLRGRRHWPCRARHADPPLPFWPETPTKPRRSRYGSATSPTTDIRSHIGATVLGFRQRAVSASEQPPEASRAVSATGGEISRQVRIARVPPALLGQYGLKLCNPTCGFVHKSPPFCAETMINVREGDGAEGHRFPIYLGAPVTTV
jgi:hypothetical protein